jgi:hypothetical protein
MGTATDLGLRQLLLGEIRGFGVRILDGAECPHWLIDGHDRHVRGRRALPSKADIRRCAGCPPSLLYRANNWQRVGCECIDLRRARQLQPAEKVCCIVAVATPTYSKQEYA